MWWNGSFVPWMCVPQISINCKMLSYQYDANISKECFQHLVESMPRRIKAVLKAKGVKHSISMVFIIIL